MKNTGVVRKIDELGRLVIPKEIRKNLNIHNGEDLQIYVENDNIVLKRHKKILTINECINKYIRVFKKFFNSSIFIVDRDNVIVSSTEDFDINSLKLTKVFEERTSLNGVYNNKYYYISPLIVDADVISAILIVNDKEIEEKDIMLVNILKNLLESEYNL